MGAIIIKPNPDDLEYVIWDTISDIPIAAGTEDDVIETVADYRETHPSQMAVLFDRADATGTSMVDGDYGWDHTHLLTVGDDGTAGLIQRAYLVEWFVEGRPSDWLDEPEAE